ncbi:phosphohistidine phosphatase SixA [Spirochaeta cellobiosiphila]|uniref:phosphohistidine phosphatase SixA n=1 Tax=Spirochaeta cellobiosiphila TaxID=504483 RepID=UPI00146AC4F6|nr:phosphohistidine phosphatase SixA [Spirochaeta cellobiosiphila]
MKLIVVRHSEADTYHSRGDYYRELTQRGLDKVHQLGTFLQKQEPIDVIIHSPYMRASQTAKLLKEYVKSSHLYISPDLVPSSEIFDILDEINSHGEERIMLVGHNPHLSYLVTALDRQNKVYALGTATAVGLQFPHQVEAGAGQILFVKETN